MGIKQALLKVAFPDLLKVFTDAAGSTPAWLHIGVVTSDLGAGQYYLANGQCHSGGDGGLLQPLGRAHAPSCLAPTGGVNFIDYNLSTNQNNLPAAQGLAATFSCMASVGELGCGFEHQLESAYKSLHDQLPSNHDFLRSDALLAVVWVTDEDDCSANPSSDLFDPAAASYGALLSYRCTNHSIFTDGNATNPPGLMPYASSNGPLTGATDAPASLNKLFTVDRYINYFTKPASVGGVKTDPTSVLLAAITGPTSDVESILGNPNTQPPGAYQSCAGPIDGKTCAVLLQHSCISTSNAQAVADPAVRLTQVVSAANDGVVSSICDDSYSAPLQSLGQKIVARLGAAGCMPSAPANPDAPLCLVYSQGDVMPACSDTNGTPPCWQLGTNAMCASGFQLAVNGLSAAGGYASCELAQ
jgi:hypothetical protein